MLDKHSIFKWLPRDCKFLLEEFKNPQISTLQKKFFSSELISKIEEFELHLISFCLELQAEKTKYQNKNSSDDEDLGFDDDELHDLFTNPNNYDFLNDYGEEFQFINLKNNIKSINSQLKEMYQFIEELNENRINSIAPGLFVKIKEFKNLLWDFKTYLDASAFEFENILEELEEKELKEKGYIKVSRLFNVLDTYKAYEKSSKKYNLGFTDDEDDEDFEDDDFEEDDE